MKDKIEQMKLKGYEFEDGLTDEEIKEIEERYNIKFPKSLIEFYKIALPVSEGFVNWRKTSEENIQSIKERLARPYDEIFWSMEENDFWVDGWDKPDSLEEKKKKFIEEMKEEPTPIPIYIHRCILSKEGIDDPAVLSMKGSDIIVYGNNLEEYLDNEFINTQEKHERNYSDSMGKWVDIMESY